MSVVPRNLRVDDARSALASLFPNGRLAFWDFTMHISMSAISFLLCVIAADMVIWSVWCPSLLASKIMSSLLDTSYEQRFSTAVCCWISPQDNVAQIRWRLFRQISSPAPASLKWTPPKPLVSACTIPITSYNIIFQNPSPISTPFLCTTKREIIGSPIITPTTL